MKKVAENTRSFSSTIRFRCISPLLVAFHLAMLAPLPSVIKAGGGNPAPVPPSPTPDDVDIPDTILWDLSGGGVYGDSEDNNNYIPLQQHQREPQPTPTTNTLDVPDASPTPPSPTEGEHRYLRETSW